MRLQIDQQLTEVWGMPNIIGATSLLVAILAVFVMVWIHRKQAPKRRMKYTIRSIPLLVDHAWAQYPTVELRVNGEIVKNPYVVTFTVWSNSRADISNNHFNANKPLVFELDLEALYESNVSSMARDGQELNLRLDGKAVLVDPCLIKPDDRAQASYIFDGDPKIVVRSQLIDIKFDEVEALTERGKGQWEFRIALFTVIIATIATLLMLAQLILAAIGPLPSTPFK